MQSESSAQAALERVQQSLERDGRHVKPLPSRLQKILGIAWVTGTTALISCIAYTSQIFVIIPTYDSAFDERIWRELLLFNFLVISVFWTYTKVVTTDPGKVPPNWKPPFELDESENSNNAETVIEVKKLTGRPRYCRYCMHYKPPRAHHCRQCQRCVLKLDHHCPWTNNCIGHANYASFIRFLCSVDVACGFHLYLITRAAFGDTFYSRAEPSGAYIIMLVVNYALSIPVIVAVGFFTIYHLWCLATNCTTIESMEKDRAATMARRGRIQEIKFPYDVGVGRNIASVLGDKPSLWCWPGTPAFGDGLSYPTNAAVHPDEQYLWPPADLFAEGSDDGGLLAPNFYDSGDSSQSEDNLDEDLSDDDDDLPLNELRRRVRRGSEGYEVRPMRPIFDAKDDSD